MNRIESPDEYAHGASSLFPVHPTRTLRLGPAVNSKARASMLFQTRREVTPRDGVPLCHQAPPGVLRLAHLGGALRATRAGVGRRQSA
jgi:hypothetical protein